MTKITIATVKSFIKKNYTNIYTKCTYSHSGGGTSQFFKYNNHTNVNLENTLGLADVWFIGGKNWVELFEDENLKGFMVSNCCNCFFVAIKKNQE